MQNMKDKLKKSIEICENFIDDMESQLGLIIGYFEDVVAYPSFTEEVSMARYEELEEENDIMYENFCETYSKQKRDNRSMLEKHAGYLMDVEFSKVNNEQIVKLLEKCNKEQLEMISNIRKLFNKCVEYKYTLLEEYEDLLNEYCKSDLESSIAHGSNILN